MILIIIGSILLVEIGLKIYTHKALKDLDGLGGMHEGGDDRDTIHLQ